MSGNQFVSTVAIILLSVVNSFSTVESSTRQLYEWDDQGYVLYCPCTGGFGNQASHFLGVLSFAKKLNRTLVIPPWRLENHNVPFSDLFQLEPVQSYHKSLPLEDFMEQLAPERWPPGNRTGYCFELSPKIAKSCHMTSGDRSGPFWDEFGVEFVNSEFIQLPHLVEMESVYESWIERYPPSLHPVMVFKSAPASFSVSEKDRQLQRYVKWNERVDREAEEFIEHTIGDSPYIGVHLRMGEDWGRRCKTAAGWNKYRESDQCLKDIPGAKVTRELCLPSVDVVTNHVMSLIAEHGNMPVFVASDVTHDAHNLKQILGRKVPVYYVTTDKPELDLILLGRADYFIGNCVSSFSAFVKRERDVNGKPSEFFGLDQLKEDVFRMNRRIEL